MTLEEAIQQYRQMHFDNAQLFRGQGAVEYAGHIKRALVKYEAKTLLDYGCGQGEQYTLWRCHDWWGVEPVLYDPGVERYEQKPVGTFDAVICTDVMEHIPEPHVLEVLHDIWKHARLFVFLTICCRPASKKLPNGENAHCTIKPEDEWRAIVKSVSGQYDVPAIVEFTR